MLYTFILILIIVGISVLLLGIKIFFTKNGKFPETHVSHNKALQKKGVTCAKRMDIEERSKKGLFETE